MPDIQGLCGLLEKHSWEPIVRIAATFRPAIGSEEDRIALARNGLLPLLFTDSYPAHLRITSAYLLHVLYDHPTQPNPFREHLQQAFQIERSKVISEADLPQPGRAQLVFTLWRLLMGGVASLSQYSPRYLSQEYLPSQNLSATLSLLFEGRETFQHEQHQRTRSQSPPIELSPAPSSSFWAHDINSPRPPSHTSYTHTLTTPSEFSQYAGEEGRKTDISARPQPIPEFGHQNSIMMDPTPGHVESSYLGYHRPRPLSNAIPSSLPVSWPPLPSASSPGEPSAHQDPLIPSGGASSSENRRSAGVIGSGRPATRALSSASSSSGLPQNVTNWCPPKWLSEYDRGPLIDCETRLEPADSENFGQKYDRYFGQELWGPSADQFSTSSAFPARHQQEVTSTSEQFSSSQPAEPQPDSFSSLRITDDLSRLNLSHNNTRFSGIPLSKNPHPLHPFEKNYNLKSPAESLMNLAVDSFSSHNGAKMPYPSPSKCREDLLGLSALPKQPDISSTAASTKPPDPPVPPEGWQEFTKAVRLFVDARDRVLTLAERRLLQPYLPAMTQPICILQPGDISSLVMKNPDVAIKLLVILLDRTDENDVPRRNGNGNDTIIVAEPPAVSTKERAELHLNGLSREDVAEIMTKVVVDSALTSKPTSLPQRKDYITALQRLPPIRQSFDVIAGLIKPAIRFEDEMDTPETRVAEMIRVEVLGDYVAGCVNWIEMAEREERQGEVFDDRVAVATGNLCRFYSSLLSNGLLSIDSEVDTTEMATFALQFSRFEEARRLYSHLAEARA